MAGRTNQTGYKPSQSIKLRYAPHALLFIVCFIACIVLFHDLMPVSPVLWTVITIAVTGGVFGLVYWIRRKSESSHGEDN